MTSYKSVYLKCLPQADNSAIIDSTTPWVQDLPTTKDGYIYIFLGNAYGATTIELVLEHPIYWHDGEKINTWTGVDVVSKQYVDAAVAAVPTGADWNAAAGEDGYIENRICYDDIENITYYENDSVAVNNSGYISIIDNTLQPNGFSDGMTVIVQINDNVYNIIVNKQSDYQYNGNLNNISLSLSIGYYDSWDDYNYSTSIIISGLTSFQNQTVSLKVTYQKRTTHKLPERFLYLTNLRDGSAGGSVRGYHAGTESSQYTMGIGAVAIGSGTKASGAYSYAEGLNTIASNEQAHAEGRSTIASGNTSHAEGGYTKASNNYSHAEGLGTEGIVSYTVTSVSGSTTQYTTSSNHSLTIGDIIKYNDIYATVTNVMAPTAFELNKTIGTLTNAAIRTVYGIASGYASHAEGYYTIATGQDAHSEGYQTKAITQNAHAEGSNTTASGESSHAEGYLTKASGKYSHAEGQNTQATGHRSHAEGQNAIASGEQSHAEGYYTNAFGNYSHAEGNYTTAQRKSQHVFGEYNVLDTAGTTTTRGNYVEIVGNGSTNNARSNARTLDWNGNEVLAGKLTVGAAPTANMDVTTKYYVDNSIASAVGNVNSFEISVVQTLPTTNIQEHTIYLVPKTGDTNDAYDEYMYINNAWEMIGNTLIDLSNYVISEIDGFNIANNDGESINIGYHNGTSWGPHMEVTSSRIHIYGLDTPTASTDAANKQYVDSSPLVMIGYVNTNYSSPVSGQTYTIYKDSSFQNAYIYSDFAVEPYQKNPSNVITIKWQDGDNNWHPELFFIKTYEYNYELKQVNGTASYSYNTWHGSNGPSHVADMIYQAGEPDLISVDWDAAAGEDGYIANKPYNVTTIPAQYGTLYEGNINDATSQQIGESQIYYKGLTVNDIYNYDSLKITFNNQEYTINGNLQSSNGVYVKIYGESTPNGPIFTNYPFYIAVLDITTQQTNVQIYTQSQTYSLKIEALIIEEVKNVTTENDFHDAVLSIGQSDWEINDKNQDGYIKNRPFYSYYNIGTDIFNLQLTLAEENNELVSQESLIANFSAGSYEQIALMNQNEFILTIDNNEYILKRYSTGSYTYCLSDSTDNNVTKTIYLNCVTYGTTSINKLGISTDLQISEGTHTVSLKPRQEIIKKLDSKYLNEDTTIMHKDVDYVTAGKKSGTTLGTKATAEGKDTTASGQYSHAEGNGTTASNGASHAEGYYTTASGQYSHAEGNSTTASNEASHAEGYHTTASGEFSHAEGYYATASGSYSHTEGWQTRAQRRSQHVFGEFNVLDTTGANGTVKGSYIEIVGNGANTSARSNARTLDWNGNEVLAGKLTVGTAPTNNMDVTTKQYVDAAVAAVPTGADWNAAAGEDGYIANKPYSVTTTPAQYSTLYEGSINDAAFQSAINVYQKILTINDIYSYNTLVITFNNQRYIVNTEKQGSYQSTPCKMYGEDNYDGPVFTNYPFYLIASSDSTNNTNVYTQSQTYSLKIEALTIEETTNAILDEDFQIATTSDWQAEEGNLGYIKNKPYSVTVIPQHFETQYEIDGTTAQQQQAGDDIIYATYFTINLSTFDAENLQFIFNDNIYNLPDNSTQYAYIYGELNMGGAPVFTNYPLAIRIEKSQSSNNATVYTQSSSFSLKINTLTEEQKNITTSNDFYDAVLFAAQSDWEASIGEDGYIKNKPYTSEIVGDTTFISNIQITLTEDNDNENWLIFSNSLGTIPSYQTSYYQNDKYYIVSFNNKNYKVKCCGYIYDNDTHELIFYGYCDNPDDLDHAKIKIWANTYYSAGISKIQISNALLSSGSYTFSMSDTIENVTKKIPVKYLENTYVIAGQKTNTTLGDKATAEGYNTTASGYTAHAEGSNTTASGYYSHAEGNYTTASNSPAHAEGDHTTASGSCSHTEGEGTIAQRRSQHVFGEYNILDTTGINNNAKGDYIEIVGNGTADNARSNARTLDWNGNEVLAGKLTVGAAPTANMDVATKQYVDNSLTITNTLSSGLLIATINGTNIYIPTSYTDADGVSY